MEIRNDYIAKGYIRPGNVKLNAAELSRRGYYAASFAAFKREKRHA